MDVAVAVTIFNEMLEPDLHGRPISTLRSHPTGSPGRT
jgi:hypothetical protein